jgi:hypothetical protein
MRTLLWIFSILIIFNSSVSAQDLKTRTDEFPKKEMKSQNKIVAEMFVEEISKNLPQKIDKYTQFINITNKDTTLIYTFEINTGSKSDDAVRKEDRTRMHKAIQNGICKSSQKFLEAGINTSYVYISAISKAHLFQFDITQQDCIELTN